MLTSAHAPAQLVQLREAKTLGVLDHHDCGIGHIHADFYDCCRDQRIQVAASEGRHCGFFFGRVLAVRAASPVGSWRGRPVAGLQRRRWRLAGRFFRIRIRADRRHKPDPLAAVRYSEIAVRGRGPVHNAIPCVQGCDQAAGRR